MPVDQEKLSESTIIFTFAGEIRVIRTRYKYAYIGRTSS